MSDMLAFSLIAPNETLVSRDVLSVHVPGIEGNFSVMANHVPMITSLRPGFIGYTGSPGDGASDGSDRYFVFDGVVEVTAHAVTVLSNRAFPAAQLNSAAIEEALARANQALERATTEGGRQAARADLLQLEDFRMVTPIDA